MHLKNCSLIYSDRRNARLAPAYDFVSTIPYIEDEHAALKYSRTKRFDEFTINELKHLAAKAKLPQKNVIDTATETVERFQQYWQKEKRNLPLFRDVIEAIDKLLATIPLYSFPK